MMKNLRLLFSAIVLIIVFSVSIEAQTVNPLCVDGRIYFKIKDHVSLNVASPEGKINPKDVYFLQDLVDEYGIETMEMPFFTAESDILQRTFKMDFNEWYMIDNLVRDLNQHVDIEYAEKAPLFFISSVPNDPYYGEVTGGGIFGSSANAKWHLDLINAEAAWDVTTGDPNIVVAVLDNAIYVDHPDLQDKIVSQIDLGNGDDDPTPPDFTYIWSHGTHSAGLIGAATNNGIGVASIGYNISIMAVKLGDDASDGQAMAAGFEGIVWAADNGADVINMSWGSPMFFQTMQNTVNYAYNKGCVMVGAAGNNGNGMETQMNPDIPVNYVGYPAALEHVIAVGSCDVGDNKSDFSNYGTWIDVLAPGGYFSTGFLGIGGFTMLSTVSNEAGGLTEVLNGTSGGAGSFGIEGQYDIMQGTSMAAPVTAGLCGLILSVNPDLTPEELTAILKNTCDNVNAQNEAFIDSIGAGRINAEAAVIAAQDAVSDFVADFEADVVVIPEEGTVNFSDLTIGDPTEWSWEFEGGTPAVSSDQNPTVTYNEAGIFQVTLTASNGTDSDTEIKTNFIIVGAGSGGAESAWIEQNTHFAAQFRGVFMVDIVDQNTAWILTYDGTGGSITRDFARTTDAGDTWIPDTIEVAENFAPGDISAIDGQNAWVAVYDVNGGGGIYNTSDGGQNWEHQSTAAYDGSTSFCNVIQMFNENDGYTMGDPEGDEFEIYTTNNGGDNWTRVDGANIPNPETNEMGWTGVKDAVGNTSWFGTSTGRIFRTQDKGQTWEVFDSGEANVSRISFWDENNGVIICQVIDQNTGQVQSWSMRKTSDGGENWTAINIPEENQLSDVSAVPGSLGMLVGVKISQTIPGNFSAYSMDYGTSWEILDDSVQYTCVQMMNESTGWAGGFNLDAQTSGIFKWAGGGVGGLHFSSSPVTEVPEMDAYTYNILAEDSEGLDITIDAIDIPEWLTLTDNGDGTALLEGTAPAVSDPVESFAVEIEADNGEETVQQTFTINVNTINEAPVFTSVPEENHVTHVLYEYNVTTEDPNDDDMVISATTLPSWATFTDNGDGTGYLSGTPTNTSIIGYQVVLTVSDGMFEATQTFRVKVTENTENIAPYFTSTPVESHVTDVLYEYNITSEDSNDDELTITATILPEWASIVDNGDGTAYLSGTPTEVNLTGYEVELKVSDGELEDVQNFLIQVEQNSIVDFGMGTINIYPNPVSNMFYVSNARGLNYRLYNILGECLLSGTFDSDMQFVLTSDLSDGEYILQLFDDERVANFKISKLK
jgi:subtilisin family serine protease/photosystem II stability/assembly factor-like uncharacterized protein